MPNRLAGEKSPYLQQHAENPVDWYPWGEEAFARARAEDKPIFLSVGYSTCHWCHVMEHESFEDARVAALMNEHFVSIKVDREERPDVDRVYMTFVQATTGAGGWPMSVFLTPELTPFYGGTYFPPTDRYGRPGFTTLLARIAEIWRDKKDKIRESGRDVIDQMKAAEGAEAAPVLLAPGLLDQAAQSFASVFDPEHAGFGRAPKFPRPTVHNFLLAQYARTGDAKLAHMVLATLHLMGRGGMYDHLAGGFHRYSVDAFWHVPHFEKMLYDQAQLVVSYLEGYQVSGDPTLARIARETCDYVLGELCDPATGAFFSAEDADSAVSAEPGAKKEEGAFYVWTRAEIEAVLGPATDVFAHFYAVEAEGNAGGELAGKNVLHAVTTVEESARRFGRPVEEIVSLLADARARLREARARRPRPHRDEKVVTAWNGMMIGALARAHQVLGEPRYLAAAERAARFVTTTLYDAAGGRLWRRFKDGEAAFEGYLDDWAQLAAGLVDLYEAGFALEWLELAERLTEQMIERFADEKEGGFFTTSGRDPSVLLRMKDDYDGAEPAGGSVAALTLIRLGHVLDRPEWIRRAEGTLRAMSARLARAPQVMPQMLVAFAATIDPPLEIVVAGEAGEEGTRALLAALHSRYLPPRTLLGADAAARAKLAARMPWLAGMGPVDGRPAAYVCRQHACERPVTDPGELLERLPIREMA